MKKIISFDKNLEFNSMIGSISSISLDNNLSFDDDNNISGNLLVSGSYRLTEASRLEEDFEFKIPVDIIINEDLDLDSSTIEIEDFTYKLLNNDTLECHIEIKIEGIENVKLEEEVEQLNDDVLLSETTVDIDRECDDDVKVNVTNAPDDEIKEIEESIEDNDFVEDNSVEKIDNVGSLFSSLNDSDDTFSTYSVYIKRKDESIDYILNKYNVTKEELENYNDLSNLEIGSKIIIPSNNENS